MKTAMGCSRIVGAALLAIACSAVAHHGQAGLFDESRTVQVSGTVKEWTFVNPHPVLVLEVARENGEVADYDVYFGPSAVSYLRARGFSAATFEVGETVIIVGHPATAAGARGIDVWGGGTSVRRANGAAVP